MIWPHNSSFLWQSPADIHLGHLWFFAIANNVPGTFLNVSLCGLCVFLQGGYEKWNCWVTGDAHLNVNRSWQIALKSSCTKLCSHLQFWENHFPTSMTLADFLIFAHVKCFLICKSLSTGNDEHLFVYLFTICISSFVYLYSYSSALVSCCISFVDFWG